MTTSSRGRARLARRLSWFVVAALAAAALAPVSTSAVGGIDPAPNAESAQAVAWVSDGEILVPPTCQNGQFFQFAVDNPVDGITANGVIELNDVEANSFDWWLTDAFTDDYDVAAVIVTGASVSNDPPAPMSMVYFYQDQTDNSDTELVTFSPDAGNTHDRLTRIEFCFNEKGQPGPSSPPPSSPPPSDPPPSFTPPPSFPPPPPVCVFPNCPTPTPVPTPTPTPTPTATPTPTPTGEVGGETGTPSVTLPPTDSLIGSTSAPAGESWRLILLAMAGILAATLLLTPAHAAAERKDR